MNYTGMKISSVLSRLIFTVALVVGMLVGITYSHHVHAFTSEVEERVPIAYYLQGSEDSGGQTNLGYLFAVYIVVWAVFFGYVGFMTRRQKEIRREINSLKSTLEEEGRLSRKSDQKTVVS